MLLKQQTKVPAVDRALTVLEVISESKRGFSISEVA